MVNDRPPDAEGSWKRPDVYDLAGTLRFIRLGGNDPTLRRGHGEHWSALQTPDGAALLRLVDGAPLRAQAWGPGAARAVDVAPDWFGLNDEPVRLGHLHPVIDALESRSPGLRLPRTGQVFEGLVRTVPQQLVTWVEAAASWRRLVEGLGDPVDGPVPLVACPTPDAVRRRSIAELQSFGLLPKMGRCLIECARRANRLNALADQPLDAFMRLVQVIRGVGPWTAGQVAGFRLGHPDAVIVGDLALPNSVAYTLTGAHRSDDDEMLALLAPFAGQRFRAIRLIMHAGQRPPRRTHRGDVRWRRG